MRNLAVDCPCCGAEVSISFNVKRAESKEKAAPNPDVKTVVSHFYNACKQVKGFSPAISGGKDGARIKQLLGEGVDVEEIKACVDWFLRQGKSNEFPTISAALSAHTMTMFRAETTHKPKPIPACPRCKLQGADFRPTRTSQIDGSLICSSCWEHEEWDHERL